MRIKELLKLRRLAVRAASIAVILGLSVAVYAQLSELRLPISLDAESTDYDGKNSMLMFKGLRLSQGNIGIEADEGRASKLDFEDSVWRFSGNVVIDVDNGHIECDSADLQFFDHQLLLAEIEGSPATFELTRPGSNDTTYAEARQLRYDLRTGTIEFSGDATITEGGNQISSSLLVYNILEQRINAQSSADGENRVKIIYTPRDTETPADGVEPEDAATAIDGTTDETDTGSEGEGP
jgi:lipopolysaccharide transport protein LptA